MAGRGMAAGTVDYADQIRRCGRAWFQAAWRVLQDVDAAEDACQQALMKACRREGAWDSEVTFRAWMKRVVINEAIDELRRRQRDRHARRTLSDGASFSGGGLLDRMALRDVLTRGLESLPDQTREVVVMRTMGGLSGNETAELMGVSSATVSRRFHEGMNQLREHLRGRAPAASTPGEA